MTLPPVPPGLEFRLEHFLEQLRAAVTAKTVVESETDPTSGADVVNENQSMNLVVDTASVLADQGTGTEDAWTTVASGAPAGARFARVRFSVNSTDNADDGDLKWRTDSAGIASPIIVECISGADDARDTAIDIVSLDASGSFQYLFTNTSGGTIDWSITYMGYSL